MTYADTYSLRTSLADWGRVANAIDGLLTGHTFTYLTATINTTSVAMVDYTSASHAITTASGEILLIIATVKLSNSADQNRMSVAINYDGNDKTSQVWTSSEAGTDGLGGHVSLFWVESSPTVGAHTIKLRWNTDAGTAYSAGTNLVSLALQTGA